MSIVMGLDQHRGQITGEWIDTDTGEVQRTRVAPADRASVRKWLSPFRGQELEVALEATTGWRFVVEELRRVGAVVHLAEPAETAGLRGPKKRAKGDRADARYLRELLMIRRLPESWIPPDYILDLRARVRLRHTLSEQRSKWQQRIQAVLYHHGCPQRRSLMTGDGREWLAAQPLPAAGRAGHGGAGDDRRDRGADRGTGQGDAARAAAGPSCWPVRLPGCGVPPSNGTPRSATCAVTLARSPAAGTPKNVRAPATTSSAILAHPMPTRTSMGESLTTNPALSE